MRARLWPQSLFGRLLAASVIAVVLAHAASLLLIAQEREHFILQGSVREWTRRIADTTLMLAPLPPAARAQALSELTLSAAGRVPHGMHHHPPGGSPPPGPAFGFLPLPLLPGFESTLQQQLRAALGAGYAVEVHATPEPAPPAVAVPVPFFEAHEFAARLGHVLRYDVLVRFPDGDTVTYRLTRIAGGAVLPRNLFLSLILLVLLLVVVLYVTARSITRPLSQLARAADSVGRDVRPAQLPERGARELREAARAFNTMQDRLRRYLDSRSRVLAAMSHDLKTPLTRLRLQVEALDGHPMQARMGRELDEMESMVHEALALFRGIDDGEPLTSVDVRALLETIRCECALLGAEVTVSGGAQPLYAKPQALKRCLTNLIANAIKFGGRAEVLLEDGPQLQVRVRDPGPGIPAAELERVFEPFYRLESSRNRDGGGSGLGLTIARDIAQAHGGTLVLQNMPGAGLEALLTLPRARGT
ncbi:MAG TPA: ATP-binding protein [Steroidobacteraceae bacterium]|nr:ATP-binding protein [Steroidobacteraceae bacterium]